MNQTNGLAPIVIRHALAALAGWLLQHGIQMDATSTGSVVAALLFFGVSSLWSVVTKRPLDASRAQTWQIIISALVRQGVAAFAGYLQASGAMGVDATDPVAVTLWAGNVAASKVKAGAKPGGGGALKLWAGLLLLASLPSCASYKEALAGIAKSAGMGLADGGVSYARARLAAEQAKYAEAILSEPSSVKVLARAAAVAMAQSALERAELELRKERGRDVIKGTLAAPVASGTTATKNPVLVSF